MCALPSNLFDLTGKVALVTGSTRGLGRAMAEALAGAGALVLINSRNADEVQSAVREIRATGGLAEPLAFDATQPEDVLGAFARISAIHGRLDILLGNTAASLRKGFEAVTEAEWETALAACLTPVWRLARAAAPLMRSTQTGAEQGAEGRSFGGGRMIFTSSINGRIVRNEMAAYAASKAGLEGLVRALAVELAPDGITVNAIAPGYFATRGNEVLRQRPGMTEKIASRVALARWGNPEELGSAALYFSSPASSYTTGVTLVVDGGLVLTI